MIEPTKPDLAEAVRGPSAAEQLAARTAGHAHRPVLPCTLRIGDANLKSHATCGSPVLPRSPTDVLTPSGQRTCRIQPEHCGKLQADAIRGLLNSIRSQRLLSWRAHGPAAAAFLDACLLLPAGRVPYASHKERAARRLTSRRE
jgi:hypothetical protein